MVSEKRNRKMDAITRQIQHCRICFETLAEEIKENAEKQNKDPFDKYDYICNHTRYANDVIYLRRQLMKLEMMLMEG